MKEFIYYPGNFLKRGPILSSAFCIFDRIGRLAPEENYDSRTTYFAREPYVGFAEETPMMETEFITSNWLESSYETRIRPRIQEDDYDMWATEQARQHGVIKNVVPTIEEKWKAFNNFETYVLKAEATPEIYKEHLGDDFLKWWSQKAMPLPIYKSEPGTDLFPFLIKKGYGYIGQKDMNERPAILVSKQLGEIYFTMLVEAIVSSRDTTLGILTDDPSVERISLLPSIIQHSSNFNTKLVKTFVEVLLPDTSDPESLYKIRQENEKRRVVFIKKLEEYLNTISGLDRPNELPDLVSEFKIFLEDEKKANREALLLAGVGVSQVFLGLSSLVFDWMDLDQTEKIFKVIETILGSVVADVSLRNVNRDFRQAEKYLKLIDSCK